MSSIGLDVIQNKGIYDINRNLTIYSSLKTDK